GPTGAEASTAAAPGAAAPGTAAAAAAPAPTFTVIVSGGMLQTAELSCPTVAADLRSPGDDIGAATGGDTSGETSLPLTSIASNRPRCAGFVIRSRRSLMMQLMRTPSLAIHLIRSSPISGRHGSPLTAMVRPSGVLAGTPESCSATISQRSLKTAAPEEPGAVSVL